MEITKIETTSQNYNDYAIRIKSHELVNIAWTMFSRLEHILCDHYGAGRSSKFFIEHSATIDLCYSMITVVAPNIDNKETFKELLLAGIK